VDRGGHGGEGARVLRGVAVEVAAAVGVIEDLEIIDPAREGSCHYQDHLAIARGAGRRALVGVGLRYARPSQSQSSRHGAPRIPLLRFAAADEGPSL